jgi:hypothetical protein
MLKDSGAIVEGFAEGGSVKVWPRSPSSDHGAGCTDIAEIGQQTDRSEDRGFRGHIFPKLVPAKTSPERSVTPPPAEIQPHPSRLAFLLNNFQDLGRSTAIRKVF